MAHVVFLWHMHQPDYVDGLTKTATMPWVRMHSVKGYLDMITVIEDFPGVRLNFNLTPVLLKQMIDLIEGRITDCWLELSRKPAADLDEREKFSLLENFFKANWDNLIKPSPRFWEMLNKRGLTFYADDIRRGLHYFSDEDFRDLQVWFNLAWCGYAAGRAFPEIARLREKDRGFTEAEKQRLLDIHLEIIALVIRKYRNAEERGQVELTTTPFYHPILPLVYDSALAERSLSGRQFPPRFSWPEDAAAHLTLAVEQHTRLFGRRPRGLWPSEGSIAPELIPLMERVGIEYFCSDEENLFNSLRLDPAFRDRPIDHLELFQGWRVQCNGGSVQALFREKPLSDFIGFMASRNDPRQAADHLLHHLRHIASIVPAETGIIPLILDGENAWETFADGGEAFLRALYGGIEAEPERLRSCTIEDYFHKHPPVREIRTLHTGSWIGSSFDLWIGDEEENRAWQALGETRAFLQGEIEGGALEPAATAEALNEIYAAEGSDWFWWYGPDFSTDNDLLFDELFRHHLQNVYRLCGVSHPVALEFPICRSQAAPLYDAPTQLISPHIDGRINSYFDWVGAGVLDPAAGQTAMYRSERLLEKLTFGFDLENFYLRLDCADWSGVTLRVRFFGAEDASAEFTEISPDSAQFFTLQSAGKKARRKSCAVLEVLEFSLAFNDLGLDEGDEFAFQVVLLRNGIELEAHPERWPIALAVPGAKFGLSHWIV